MVSQSIIFLQQGNSELFFMCSCNYERFPLSNPHLFLYVVRMRQDWKLGFWNLTWPISNEQDIESPGRKALRGFQKFVLSQVYARLDMTLNVAKMENPMHKQTTVWITDHMQGAILLLFCVLATSKVISGWVYWLVTVHTHGDFIALPHLETRPPAPWPDSPLSHIILTLSEPVRTLS